MADNGAASSSSSSSSSSPPPSSPTSAAPTPTRKRIRVAIDGPAGSGKSTTARAVAKRLRYTFIDTGAMYRAVALKTIESNVSIDDDERVAVIAREINIDMPPSDSDKTVILIDGVDRSDAIRTPEVAKCVSAVAKNPEVRAVLVAKQQRMGDAGGVVMDGRDIGTIVFPSAELKVFMLASAEERARRRLKEFEAKGDTSQTLAQVQADIEARDAADSARATGPLKKADDAVELDTTGCAPDEQIERVLALVDERTDAKQ